MAATFFSGEAEYGSTAFEKPDRYQRVEYSHPKPNKVSNTEEIKRTLTKKLTARKMDSFFMAAVPPNSPCRRTRPKSLVFSSSKGLLHRRRVPAIAIREERAREATR